MKYILIIFLVFALPAYAGNDEAHLKDLQRESEAAFALATAKLGAYKDARLNSLTNRIQDDQRVILEAIKDTARQKDLKLNSGSTPKTSNPGSKEEYLDRQITIHERILDIITESSSPVLENMRGRVQTAMQNARVLRGELIQAEESK